MAYKKRFDFSSAYGQLILLVFLPICVLAGVGAILVFSETNEAVRSEQRALAEAALIRYEPIVQQMMPILVEQRHIEDERSQNQEQIHSLSHGLSDDWLPHLSTPPQEQKTLASTSTSDSNHSVQNDDDASISEEQQATINRFQQILANINKENHLQRIAVISEAGEVLISTGYKKDSPWGIFPTSSTYVESLKTSTGTGYGSLLGEYGQQKYWLFVDMDDEPLLIARYRIILALVVTGLFTILMLLLSLNIYAKRWITPVYEMRLYLQRLTTENLYQPIEVESSGELNQLQQDLVKALRRIHSSFQDLKNHAEQTEDDLRLAFDEMEMQNISIRNARDAAVSTSQAKSAFLANISHELRTPLNSIDGFINLLARHGDLSAEQDLYVQTIRKSSAHLLALVNDVLDFSKIEAGKLVLDKHEFNLYEAIYEVMDMLSPVAAEKGLRMAVMFYDDVPQHIIGDALRVKQVLTNLVGNAIKFTDMGEVVVRVSLDEGMMTTGRNTKPMDNQLLITVQDSGKGISETAQKQLFRSFSQGDPSITRQYGGTGLGLVISKQLTRMMGGHIGFYDNEQAQLNQNLSRDLIHNGHKLTQKGSTFWFTLPANLDVLEAVEKEDSQKRQSLPQLRPLSDNIDNPLQVLIWIEHFASHQVLSAYLRPLNVTVTQASSLAGALEWLKEKNNAWDWVIVDGGNGEAQEDMAALLKQIRLHYQGKLAMFGYQIALDNNLLTRYRARALYQPLDKRQLYAMLDRKSRGQQVVVDTPRWQGIKVLAVDDHLPNLLVLDALLTELGIKVITASSGFDAIEVISKQQASGAEKERIDLIFMDIQMPRMSGHEAAQQIRKIETSGKQIPIIALTAHGLSDERDKLMKVGINDYVGKPISQPQLLQILQKWLGHESNDANKLAQEPRLASLTETESLLGKSSNLQGDANKARIAVQSGSNTRKDEKSRKDDKESLAVFDWQDALTRSANKPELAAKLALMMIDSVTDEIKALQAAWDEHDRAELAQIAHRILGASRYTGVPQLRQYSQDFEDKCLLNVQHTTPAQFTMLQPKYEALLEALYRLQDLDITEYKELSYHKLSENDMTWKMI
ncbi:response regulator [Psychrobacter sp. I-STPA6b]|uniref:response regulator n=1 Tax=Psychrobacter sp. I-STPA6b TaxID=2585718 RepID=UPI001D0CCE4F|nr:response regulator [Psychrobacter sp. I-STPA6b]